MRKILISLFLVLSGCGKPQATIDPAFLTYVNRFQAIKTVGMDTNIAFGALQSPIVGLCVTGDSPNNVTIDPTNWSTLTDLGKEQIIFHELGHCVLFLGHDRDTQEVDGRTIYQSIMYPYEFGEDSMYSDNLVYYHNELFSLSVNQDPITQMKQRFEN